MEVVEKQDFSVSSLESEARPSNPYPPSCLIFVIIYDVRFKIKLKAIWMRRMEAIP